MQFVLCCLAGLYAMLLFQLTGDCRSGSALSLAACAAPSHVDPKAIAARAPLTEQESIVLLTNIGSHFQQAPFIALSARAEHAISEARQLRGVPVEAGAHAAAALCGGFVTSRNTGWASPPMVRRIQASQWPSAHFTGGTCVPPAWRRRARSDRVCRTGAPPLHAVRRPLARDAARLGQEWLGFVKGIITLTFKRAPKAATKDRNESG